MRVTCADGQEVWFLPVDGDRVPFGSVHDGKTMGGLGLPKCPPLSLPWEQDKDHRDSY